MTAWGATWLDSIFRLYPMAKGKSAMRGRTYLSGRRVVDVHLNGNIVRARVIGHRRVPYNVTITVRTIAEDVWHAAIGLMARDQRCAASMQQGVLLPDIVDIFEVAGDALLPQDAYAISTRCGCQPRGETCDHIMGVHMWIAAAVDRDPFIMFTLRGRSKDTVLNAVTETLQKRVDGSHGAAHNAHSDVRDGASLSTTSHDTPARPPTQPLHQLLGPEAAGAAFDCWRAPVAALPLNRENGTPPDQLLAQLGNPPGWDSKASMHETLVSVYRGAARRARTILSQK